MHIHNQAMGGPGALSEAAPSLHSGQALFQEAQTGCPDSLNALVIRHDGLVQAVVRQQVLGDLPFAEALQAGRIGLWRAIQSYDPKHGTAFSTYAWPCIMRHVWRAVKVHSRFHSPLVTSDGLSSLAGPDPALVWEAAAVEQALDRLVQRLPRRLRYVVVARYGLDDTPPATYRQIGAVLSLSGERARQLHTEALVWLRHPAHSQTLRSLLGRHTLADYQLADALTQDWLRRRGGRHGR
jgi:RNA polymerase sigma factor (sigma-70 family)